MLQVTEPPKEELRPDPGLAGSFRLLPGQARSNSTESPVERG